MNEKKINNKYEKRLTFQQKMIARQSEHIKDLESQIQKLQLELEEKNTIINSVSSMREELAQNVTDTKKCKEQYLVLIEELKKMKEIVNQEVYRGRWRLIKHLIK